MTICPNSEEVLAFAKDNFDEFTNFLGQQLTYKELTELNTYEKLGFMLKFYCDKHNL